jgi:hypothetical protein
MFAIKIAHTFTSPIPSKFRAYFILPVLIIFVKNANFETSNRAYETYSLLSSLSLQIFPECANLLVAYEHSPRVPANLLEFLKYITFLAPNSVGKPSGSSDYPLLIGWLDQNKADRITLSHGTQRPLLKT